MKMKEGAWEAVAVVLKTNKNDNNHFHFFL
jgi:hypothetical protein